MKPPPGQIADKNRMNRNPSYIFFRSSSSFYILLVLTFHTIAIINPSADLMDVSVKMGAIRYKCSQLVENVMYALIKVALYNLTTREYSNGIFSGYSLSKIFPHICLINKVQDKINCFAL